jgi:hypothetical protein
MNHSRFGRLVRIAGNVTLVAGLAFGVVASTVHAGTARSTQKKSTAGADRPRKASSAPEAASASFTPASEFSQQPTPVSQGTGGVTSQPESAVRNVNRLLQAPAANAAQSISSAPDLKVGSFDPSTRNGKILEFAKAHLGQQVGNGECSSLGTEAFEFAGAELNQGTVFGREILAIEAQPGDILQFKEVELVNPDGSHWQLGDPDHTAVIGAVDARRMLIFHQNINNVKRVRTDTIDLANVKSGTVTVYRSKPKPQ